MAIYKIVVFAGDHCGPEVCLLVHSLGGYRAEKRLTVASGLSCP